MRKLVEVATRSEFDKLNKTTYNKSIVFIKDTREIWTHGVFYTQRLTQGESVPFNVEVNWQNFLVLNLPEAGTYAIQIQYGGVYYSGMFSYSAYNVQKTGNGTDADFIAQQNFIEEEIPLHASGTNTYQGNQSYARIYLKLGLSISNGYCKETLFLGASKADGQANIPVKIRQII